jgi:lipoprotein-anchoring transpeptidase ErfK/SrfK
VANTEPRVHSRKRLVIAAGVAVVALALGTVAVAAAATRGFATASTRAAVSASPADPAAPVVPAYVAPPAALVAVLPAVDYAAVVPGLMPYSEPVAPAQMTAAYTLAADAPLYGADRVVPIARFPAQNFLGEKSVVVPVAFNGAWALVLTPARQSLPSATGGTSPAQSAAWIRADALVMDHPLTQRIVISVSGQTLTIVSSGSDALESFPVGVGTPTTPTPTGVTGYLQARYLDPAQDQTVYPIDLSSLHSAAADEPYGGNDGGLIGVHYYLDHSGAVSHGCVRLPPAAITAVNQLPLGTPITITS